MARKSVIKKQNSGNAAVIYARYSEEKNWKKDSAGTMK